MPIPHILALGAAVVVALAVGTAHAQDGGVSTDPPVNVCTSNCDGSDPFVDPSGDPHGTVYGVTGTCGQLGAASLTLMLLPLGFVAVRRRKRKCWRTEFYGDPSYTCKTNLPVWARCEVCR